MTAMDWLVVLGAAGAIGWVNWYFFVAGRAVASTVPVTAGAGADVADGQRVTITVDGGYSPNTVRVKAGQPVQLVFDRKDTSSCSEEVVLPDFGVRRFLPTGKETVIEVTPAKPGRYEFMCGMSMLRGSLVAEE